MYPPYLNKYEDERVTKVDTIDSLPVLRRKSSSSAFIFSDQLTGDIFVVGGSAGSAASNVGSNEVDLVTVLFGNMLSSGARVGGKNDAVLASHSNDGSSGLVEVGLQVAVGDKRGVAEIVLEVESSLRHLLGQNTFH